MPATSAGHVDFPSIQSQAQRGFAKSPTLQRAMTDHLRGLSSTRWLDHINDCEACQNAVPANLNIADSLLDVGTIIGRFEVLAMIGSGTFGYVYRALDRELGRAVAIKVLGTERCWHPMLLEMISHEARSLAALSHPNIVTIFDVGEVNIAGAEHPYAVLELLDGASLAVNDIAADRIADLLRQLALGLAALHRHGLLHRDIKPSNIVFASDGTPKLTDFGLATAINATPSPAGTPAYMAPELVSGATATPASDQYSLALVGNELIQKVSHRGTTRALRKLQAVLQRGMAASPAERWPSTDAFAEALTNAATTTVRPMVTAATASICVLFAVAAGIYWRSNASQAAACPPVSRLAAMPACAQFDAACNAWQSKVAGKQQQWLAARTVVCSAAPTRDIQVSQACLLSIADEINALARTTQAFNPGALGFFYDLQSLDPAGCLAPSAASSVANPSLLPHAVLSIRRQLIDLVISNNTNATAWRDVVVAALVVGYQPLIAEAVLGFAGVADVAEKQAILEFGWTIASQAHARALANRYLIAIAMNFENDGNHGAAQSTLDRALSLASLAEKRSFATVIARVLIEPQRVTDAEFEATIRAEVSAPTAACSLEGIYTEGLVRNHQVLRALMHAEHLAANCLSIRGPTAFIVEQALQAAWDRPGLYGRMYERAATLQQMQLASLGERSLPTQRRLIVAAVHRDQDGVIRQATAQGCQTFPSSCSELSMLAALHTSPAQSLAQVDPTATANRAELYIAALTTGAAELLRDLGTATIYEHPDFEEYRRKLGNAMSSLQPLDRWRRLLQAIEFRRTHLTESPGIEAIPDVVLAARVGHQLDQDPQVEELLNQYEQQFGRLVYLRAWILVTRIELWGPQKDWRQAANAAITAVANDDPLAAKDFTRRLTHTSVGR